MKKRELEKALRRAGCYLKREGGSHSLWINPQTGVVEAVPRHGEIKEPLAKKNIAKPWCVVIRRGRKKPRDVFLPPKWVG